MKKLLKAASRGQQSPFPQPRQPSRNLKRQRRPNQLLKSPNPRPPHLRQQPPNLSQSPQLRTQRLQPLKLSLNPPNQSLSQLPKPPSQVTSTALKDGSWTVTAATSSPVLRLAPSIKRWIIARPSVVTSWRLTQKRKTSSSLLRLVTGFRLVNFSIVSLA